MLRNCRKNVDANAASFKHGPQVAQVRELDWLEPLPQLRPQSSARDDSSVLFSWCAEDVQALQHAQVGLCCLHLLLHETVHSLLRQLLPLIVWLSGSPQILRLWQQFEVVPSCLNVQITACMLRNCYPLQLYWGSSLPSTQ